MTLWLRDHHETKCEKIISPISQDLCPLNLEGSWLQGEGSNRKRLIHHQLFVYLLVICLVYSFIHAYLSVSMNYLCKHELLIPKSKYHRFRFSFWTKFIKTEIIAALYARFKEIGKKERCTSCFNIMIVPFRKK